MSVHPAFWALSAVSAGASAYHGVRRNRGSAGWGLAWGALGALFPVVAPAVALAQGYAQPERRGNPSGKAKRLGPGRRPRRARRP